MEHQEGKTQGRLRLNVVAVHQRLTSAEAVRDQTGHETGCLRDATIWLLPTNLPLTHDILAMYARRMQIVSNLQGF